MLYSHVLVECFKMAQSFPARKQAIQIIFLQASPSQLHKPSQKEHPYKSTNVRPFIRAYSTGFCLQVIFLTYPPSMLGLQFALHCVKSFCYYYNKDVFDPYSWTFPCAMTLESRLHWCEIHNYVSLYLYLTWPESSWMPAEPLSVPPVTLQPHIPRDDTRALPGRGLLLLPGCPDCRAHCKPQGFVSPPSTFLLHLLGYANNGFWNGTELRRLAWTTQRTHARFFRLAQLESSVSQGNITWGYVCLQTSIPYSSCKTIFRIYTALWLSECHSIYL